ncbi:NAD(+)/NADH kinase [Ilumatobacter sp.]|uniref:NAD(+)/NADH kinase n=1 Tax=Ilumatobacter sp. TaxID=1967498 RepID=UPI003B521487
MKPRRLVVVAHHQRRSARTQAERVSRWCAEHDVEFWMPEFDAHQLEMDGPGSDRSPSDADVVLSLGGDGTMLRSVALLAGAAVPLIGVNLGTLGYLTEVEPESLTDALDRFALGPVAGEWHLDERMMLDVAVNGELVGRALNEAVVEKNQSGHTVRLLARIDGDPFTHYEADGLIVATPTGSTAYSLSARGPIVSPQHRATLLTPVSPHMLFDRTLVLSPSEVVEIEVAGRWRAELALDGQPGGLLRSGDVVRCSPSVETANFVRFGAYRYHQILKTKFGLSDR